MISDPQAALRRVAATATANGGATHEPRATSNDRESLPESERRFREMIDALPAAIYTTDAQGRVTHFNPACIEFSGRTPELGSDHWCVTWKLFYPDGRPMPHDECPMAIALKEGRAIRGAEAIAERPDGTRLWFTPYPTRLLDESGAVIGGINMLVDITDRKNAEAQLAAELADTQLLQRLSADMAREDDAQTLYEKIMEAAVQIMQSDFASMQMLYPERGKAGELRLLAFRGFNPEAAKFWEWVRADSNCTCGVALRTRQRMHAANVATCEFMAGTDDRTTYLQTGILAVQSTPLISRNGKLLGMISTHWREPHEPSERDWRMFDVLARHAADLIERNTAEKTLQRLLAQRTDEVTIAQQRLASNQRMAAVGTLASGLAHDMTNLLFPLESRISALLTNKRLDDDVQNELTVITALLDHLRDLSKNLTLFSHDPEKEGIIGRTNIGQWYSSIHKLMDVSVGRGIIMKWDCPDGLPEVTIAPHRLTQAVQNLIHNARNAVLAAKAKDPRRVPRITIEARLEPENIRDAWGVSIKVIDNGIGMDEQTQRRCIEPFFTTRNRPNAPGGAGSGLGLSMTHEIAQRAGGDLHIECKPGEGTTITLKLPIASERKS